MQKSGACAEHAVKALIVKDRDGAEHRLDTVEGWRLMEILRDHGLGMENCCGGALACADCHILIDREWVDKIPAPSEEELEKLDDLPIIHDNSRLSCQILWSDDYDGLRLTIAPAS